MTELLSGTLLFLAAVMLLAYAPGRLVLHLLKSRLTPLDDATLSLVLGLVVSAWLYWVAVWAGVNRLYFLCPLFAGIFVLYKGARYSRSSARRKAPDGRLKFEGSQLILTGVIVFGITMLAILPQYYGNLISTGSGEMDVAPYDDVFLHLAIANELTHNVPPWNPMVAGHALSYHYAMDLIVAMFAVVTGLSTPDLFLRYVSTLFLVVSMLAVYCAARRWLNSGYFATLAVFLVFFGEDFSFIPGLALFFKHPDSIVHIDWSAHFFGVPAVFSLFHNNSILPAVGVLFAGIYCLHKGLHDGERAWLWISALLFAILPEVKVFAGVQMLAALAIASMVYLYRFRDGRLLWVVIPATICALPALANYAALNRQGALLGVDFDPLPRLFASMVAVGLKSLANPAGLVFLGLPILLLEPVHDLLFLRY